MYRADIQSSKLTLAPGKKRYLGESANASVIRLRDPISNLHVDKKIFSDSAWLGFEFPLAGH